MGFADLQQRLSSLLVLRCVCVCLGPLVGAAWGAWGPRGVGRTATTRAYGTLGTERKGKEILTSISINCVLTTVTLLQQKTGSDLGPRMEVKVGVWNQDYHHSQAAPSGRGGRGGRGRDKESGLPCVYCTTETHVFGEMRFSTAIGLLTGMGLSAGFGLLRSENAWLRSDIFG